MRALLTATALTIPLLAQPLAADTYVIGDSLNDTGTFAPVTVTGRFTTTPGLLWTEIVAAERGDAVAPAFLFREGAFEPSDGGTNYAQSGALVTDEAGLWEGQSRPVVWQIDRLFEADADLTGDLVLMDGGGPDLVKAAMAIGGGEMTPEDGVAMAQDAGRALAAQAARLEEAGADVVLVGVADFGTVPIFQGGEAAGLMTMLSRTFNEAMAEEADALGLAAIRPDIFTFFGTVIADPAAYDLENVTDPAVRADVDPTPTGTSANSGPADLVRADAATRWLFADGLHPTGRGHALLAEFILNEMQD